MRFSSGEMSRSGLAESVSRMTSSVDIIKNVKRPEQEMDGNFVRISVLFIPAASQIQFHTWKTKDKKNVINDNVPLHLD